MTRAQNGTFVSVYLSNAEKQVLDDAVEADALAAGHKPNRNRFIRDWISTLVKR